MTIKEMATVAGVSPETVRAKAKEMLPNKFVNGKRTELNQTEAVLVMAELRKKGFVQPTENMEVPTENQKVQTDRLDRLDRLESLMDKMLVAIGNMMILQQSAPAKQPGRVMLPAPQLDARAHIIKIINNYVSRTGFDHRDAYIILYREFGYRTKCNPALCAKNRGMNTIDYIESEGMIETLEAIAMEVL